MSSELVEEFIASILYSPQTREILDELYVVQEWSGQVKLMNCYEMFKSPLVQGVLEHISVTSNYNFFNVIGQFNKRTTFV